MSIRKLTANLAVLAALALVSSQAVAQNAQPFGPINWDPQFDPIANSDYGSFNSGLNDFNRPRLNEGMFFEYERLNWHVSLPDQRVLGSTNAVLPPFIPGQAFRPANSIDVASPILGFGWGNRYTLGYVVDDKGWITSILGGYDRDQRLTYGFGLNAEGAPVPDGQLDVVVLFSDPFGLISGFIDVTGPNGVADGIDDDINGNLVFGRFGVDTDIPPDGTPDAFAPVDLGDLITLAPAFDTVTTVQLTQVDGIEMMKLCRFGKPFHENVFVEWYAGVRYLKIRDRFNVTATGGILADSFWNTQIQNDIVGPQVGFRYLNKRGRWSASVEARFLAGYNRQDYRQQGALGTQLNTGEGGENFGLPISMGPTAFRHQMHEDVFAPVGEVRLQASFEMTKSIAFKFGWTGIFAGGIARASNAVVYQVPAMGLTNANRSEDLIINGFNLGVEVNR